jgi:2-methylisocitrate lyase-like PEP mutase family enzyme
MKNMMDDRLKRRLQSDEILVVPAAFDMVSAKIIEKEGFEAVYLSGFGQSASHLGLPDAGMMTFSEIVERIHNMANAVSCPLLADGDTGYGGIINVKRTVEEFEWAGASAIQIEDQEIPKRCGHTKGKRLIPAREMALKIEAATAARRNDDFLIIARTDARSVSGFQDALNRGKMYEKAGADVIFLESPQSMEELRIIGQTFERPTMANMVHGGKTPMTSVRELQDMGFSLVAFAVTCLLAAAKAMEKVMGILKKEGTIRETQEDLMDFDAFNSLIGFPDVYDFESRFKLPEETK